MSEYKWKVVERQHKKKHKTVKKNANNKKKSNAVIV